MANLLGNTTIGGKDTSYISGVRSSNNAAVGGGMQVMGTGANNVSVGYYSMAESTNAGSNTAVGTMSLRRITTGWYNTAIGATAGSYVSSGEGNTLIGTSTGHSIATGEYNTALGDAALYSCTGSGNVAIGNHAGFYHTGSNKLFIANNQYDTLIEGDFSDKTVNINGTLLSDNIPVGTPVGTMIEFAGTAAPEGYLVCNGGTVSTTTYAKLYAVIEDAWATTGSAAIPDIGTFRLPPSSIGGYGVFKRAVGVGSGIVGGYHEDAIRNIKGEGGSTVSYGTAGAMYSGTSRPTLGGSGYGLNDVHFDASRVVPVAAENRPKAITVLSCIKY